MKSLESMERNTPEFQRLTPAEQNGRRNFLSQVLEELLKNPSELGVTQKETGVLTGILLEFHLTGAIDRFEKTPKTKKERRT